MVLLASGYAFARLQRPADEGPPVPPPGAADPLNPPVYVAGGRFLSGNPDADTVADPGNPFSTEDEGPVRSVDVEPFWIQSHEVTNEEYRRFDPDHAFPAGRERHPVVGVTWRQAMAYARWRGGALPTEEQWELAARGTEARTYPWGEAPPTCERAHFEGCEPEGTVEVTARPAGATPEGIHDLAGNVWEWVMPFWIDPRWPVANDASRRMRGGSFDDAPFFLRPTNRSNGFFAGFRDFGTGFRVAWPAKGR